MRFLNPAFRTFPLVAAAVLSSALLTPLFALETGLDLGQSSFKFLKLSLSPRSVAMGGAGAGLVESAGESDLNPAAAALGGGALVMGQEYPPQEFGTTASHLSWSLPWGERRVTLNTRYLGFDKIPGWDGDGTATTAYDAYTFKVQAGLAGMQFGVAYGASIAYAQNNIAEASYSAAMINLGLYRSFGHGISLGGSMMNADFYTASSKPGSEKPLPPVIFQAGLGYARALRPGMRLATAVDVRKVNDEDIVYPVGAELMVMDALFIRAGYPVGDPDNEIGLGFGLKWSRFGFNYAYKGHSELSGGHSWTLEIRD